jgi:hypothetical protein
MIDPCKDCLINTVCGELCEPRREYRQDVAAELKGQIILFRKGMITEEKYKSIMYLYRKVEAKNFEIQLRGGTWEGDESSSSIASSSSSSTSTVRRRIKWKHRIKLPMNTFLF